MNRAALPLALSLVLCGCRAPRPASVEKWQACLVEHARIEQKGDRPVVVAGDLSVLFLHARWGDSPFVTEYSWGETLLELPAPLAVGTTVILEDAALKVSHREGGQALVFVSSRFEGSLGILRLDPRMAEIGLDLGATAPTVDLAKRGSVTMSGNVTAARVASITDCP